MLEVDDLNDVLEQAEKTAGDIDISDKAEFMERQLHECAKKKNIVPQLRITDEPWFK